MSLNVKPLQNIGAEVCGFDISQPVGEDVQSELRSLWYEHGMLLFRDQPITPENQISFSRIFGPLAMHPLKVTRSEQYPELFVLTNGDDKDKAMTASYHGKDVVGRLDWH
ncbi:MAG: TauD/TfdA family dioxygenase, partial [Halioglobus sp.]|nr:TauD/TfdA family dioxygenase [Halioglobus sp.]